MKWYTLYRDSDGTLLGHGSKCRSAERGETLVEHDSRQDQEKTWNPHAKVWVARKESNAIPIEDLFSRLTTEEKNKVFSLDPSLEISQRIDAAISRVKTLSKGVVHLDNPVLDGLFTMLVASAVITEERKGEILS